MMRAKPLSASLAATLVFFCGACEPQTDTRQIVIAEPTEVDLLFPLAGRSDLEAELDKLLYLGLNSARWQDGRVDHTIDELSLAEGWRFGPDSTTITYDLRSDAFWSDGHQIDAGDVVFTYELMRRLGPDFPYSEYYREIDSVQAVDTRLVRFHFARRYPQMLLHSGYSIVPEHVYRDYEPTREALARHPGQRSPGDSLVVSGPYFVAQRRPGERLVLQENPRFAGDVDIPTVVFRFIPEAATRVVELQNGSVDVINPAPAAMLRRLAQDERLSLEPRGARFYDYVAWNGARFEPFADPEIRRALSLAIDRQAILDGLQLSDYATPAAGPFPPIFSRATGEPPQADPYAPDSARAILADLGWRDTDDDGIIDRDGVSFRFTLLTSPGSGLLRSSVAEILQARLAQVGVGAEIRQLESSTLNELVYFDSTRQFEAALVGWRTALDGTHVEDQFWPPDAQYNITGYSNAAIDTLIPLALGAATQDQSAGYWNDAARVIAADRPYLFLWFYGEAVALTSRISNTRIDTYSVYQNLYQWKLEP
jgi:peptide/nickel transport system substrate-binding protein